MYSNNRHKKIHYKGGGLFDNFVKKVFPDVNLDEYRYELHYYKKDGNIIKYDSIDLNTPISNILNFSVGDDVEIVFPYSPKPNNEDMVLSTKISLKNQGITPELLQNCCPDKIIKIGEIPNKVIYWNEYEQNNLDTPNPDYETNLQRIPNVISWKTQNRKLNKEDIPEGTQLDSDIDLDDTEYGAALLLSMKKDNETNSPSPIEEKETEDINRENQEVYEDARGIEAAEAARLVLRGMDQSEYTTNTDSTKSGGGKKSKRKPNKSKEFDHNLQIKIIQVQNDNEKEKLSFILQSNNGEKYKENILRKMLKDGKFSISETEELLNAIKYMPFAIENVDTKKFENIQIRYFPDKIKENEAMKNSISKIKKELVDLHLLKLQKEIHFEYTNKFNKFFSSFIKSASHEIEKRGTGARWILLPALSQNIFNALAKTEKGDDSSKKMFRFFEQTLKNIKIKSGESLAEAIEKATKAQLSGEVAKSETGNTVWKEGIQSCATLAIRNLDVIDAFKSVKMDGMPDTLPNYISESLWKLNKKAFELKGFDEYYNMMKNASDEYEESVRILNNVLEDENRGKKLNQVLNRHKELIGEIVTIHTNEGKELFKLKGEMREGEIIENLMLRNKTSMLTSTFGNESINDNSEKKEPEDSTQDVSNPLDRREALIKRREDAVSERERRLDARMRDADNTSNPDIDDKRTVIEILKFFVNKLPKDWTGENGGNIYREVLRVSLRPPDGKPTKIEHPENKGVIIYAVDWAKDEQTLQQLVNILEYFNYITQNKPIYNEIGPNTLDTLNNAVNIILSAEAYSKRQINNLAEDIINIRNALFPSNHSIEMWKKYDDIKKTYNGFRNYLVRAGWRFHPSERHAIPPLGSKKTGYHIYKDNDGKELNNTEFQLVSELINLFSILLPKNTFFREKRLYELEMFLEIYKPKNIDDIPQKSFLKGQIEQTDYITSILKGILELPSDKNKYTPSQLSPWRILDVHKKSPIVLEKLLEEEKKRLEVNTPEGYTFKDIIELSNEEIDKYLKLDQLKEQDDEAIESTISPIVDELIKETATNSDYLNEIIDEARTQEIQKEAYFTDWIHVDSDSDSDIPSWKLRNIDSDSDSEDDKLGVEESKRESRMPPIMISASSEEDMLPNLAEALDAMRDQSARFRSAEAQANAKAARLESQLRRLESQNAEAPNSSSEDDNENLTGGNPNNEYIDYCLKGGGKKSKNPKKSKDKKDKKDKNRSSFDSLSRIMPNAAEYISQIASGGDWRILQAIAEQDMDGLFFEINRYGFDIIDVWVNINLLLELSKENNYVQRLDTNTGNIQMVSMGILPLNMRSDFDENGEFNKFISNQNEKTGLSVLDLLLLGFYGLLKYEGLALLIDADKFMIIAERYTNIVQDNPLLKHFQKYLMVDNLPKGFRNPLWYHVMILELVQIIANISNTSTRENATLIENNFAFFEKARFYIMGIICFIDYLFTRKEFIEKGVTEYLITRLSIHNHQLSNLLLTILYVYRDLNFASYDAVAMGDMTTSIDGHQRYKLAKAYLKYGKQMKEISKKLQNTPDFHSDDDVDNALDEINNSKKKYLEKLEKAILKMKNSEKKHHDRESAHIKDIRNGKSYSAKQWLNKINGKEIEQDDEEQKALEDRTLASEAVRDAMIAELDRVKAEAVVAKAIAHSNLIASQIEMDNANAAAAARAALVSKLDRIVAERVAKEALEALENEPLLEGEASDDNDDTSNEQALGIGLTSDISEQEKADIIKAVENSLQDQPIPYSNETEEDELDDLPPLLDRDEVDDLPPLLNRDEV
jgi:hypothetical protein